MAREGSLGKKSLARSAGLEVRRKCLLARSPEGEVEGNRPSKSDGSEPRGAADMGRCWVVAGFWVLGSSGVRKGLRFCFPKDRALFRTNA